MKDFAIELLGWIYAPAPWVIFLWAAAIPVMVVVAAIDAAKGGKGK